MKFNGIEYRDWRKIANAIKEGKTKTEIIDIIHEGECILCENSVGCGECPLDFCMVGSMILKPVWNWLSNRDNTTRKQALKSAGIIADIIEGTVCI